MIQEISYLEQETGFRIIDYKPTKYNFWSNETIASSEDLRKYIRDERSPVRILHKALPDNLEKLQKKQNIHPKTITKIKKSIENDLDHFQTNRDLTFESDTAKKLSEFAQKILDKEADKNGTDRKTCRVGILERGLDQEGHVYPDGTIILSQHFINQLAEELPEDNNGILVLAVVAHEVGHIVKETSGVSLQTLNIVDELVNDSLHEAIADTLATVYLDESDYPAEYVEEAFKRIRLLYGNNSSHVHQTPLTRELQQLAFRSRIHGRSGDNTFQIEAKDVIPSNLQLITNALKNNTQIPLELLTLLSEKDFESLGKGSFSSENNNHQITKLMYDYFANYVWKDSDLSDIEKWYLTGNLTAGLWSVDNKTIEAPALRYQDYFDLISIYQNDSECQRILDAIKAASKVRSGNIDVDEMASSYIMNLAKDLQEKIKSQQFDIHEIPISLDDQNNLLEIFKHFYESKLFEGKNSYYLNGLFLEIVCQTFFHLEKYHGDHNQDLFDQKLFQTYLQKTVTLITEHGEHLAQIPAEHIHLHLNGNFRRIYKDFKFDETDSSSPVKSVLEKFYYKFFGEQIYHSRTIPPAPEDENEIVEYSTLISELETFLEKDFESNGESPKKNLNESITFISKIQDNLRKISQTQEINLNEFKKILNLVDKLTAKTTAIYIHNHTEFSDSLQVNNLFYYKSSVIKTLAELDPDHTQALHDEFCDSQMQVLDLSLEMIKTDDRLPTLSSSFDSIRHRLDEDDKVLRNIMNETFFKKVYNHEFWDVFRGKIFAHYPISTQGAYEFSQNSTLVLEGDFFNHSFTAVSPIVDTYREFLNEMVNQSQIRDIPDLLPLLESVYINDKQNISRLLQDLRLTYLLSDEIDFKDKCRFFELIYSKLGERGLNILAKQAKTPEDVNELLDTFNHISTNLAEGQDSKEFQVAYGLNIAFEFLSNAPEILVDSCKVQSPKASQKLFSQWLLAKPDSMSTNGTFTRNNNHLSDKPLALEQMGMKSLQELFDELHQTSRDEKLLLIQKALTNKNSPLTQADGPKKQEFIATIISLLNERNRVTKTILEEAIKSQDQAMVVTLLSEVLADLLFRGCQVELVNIEKEVKHDGYTKKVEDTYREHLRYRLTHRATQVEPNLGLYQLAEVQHSIQRQDAINDNIFQKLTQKFNPTLKLQNLESRKTSVEDQSMDEETLRKIRLLEKAGAHYVKNMQIMYQLYPNLDPKVRETLGQTADSMQALNDFWTLYNLHEIAERNAKVQEFVNCIEEYGGYIGGGSLFSVYKVKAKLPEWSESKWCAIKMIRPYPNNFNSRNRFFTNDSLERAKERLPKRHHHEINRLQFISELSANWVQEEIDDPNFLENDKIFRSFYQGDDDIFVSNLILTTDEMIIEDLVEGDSLTEILSNPNLSQDQRETIRERYQSYLWSELSKLDLEESVPMHSDPHVGNIIVNSNGQICVIDRQRAIVLDSKEKQVFKLLKDGKAQEFLDEFVSLILDRSEVDLNSKDKRKLVNKIKRKIVVSKLKQKALFRKPDESLELQILVDELIKVGLTPKSFSVDWLLTMRNMKL